MDGGFNYGGQAVIEGVMMRGSRSVAVALRHPRGHIVVETQPLNEALYRGPVSRIPFLRGLVLLWDALGLGMKALMMSADVAAGEEVSLSDPARWTVALLGVGLGVGLFMVLPSFLAGLLAPFVASEWLSSLLEGVVRLLLVLGYVWGVGYLPDMRRVFAYHGAEHKTINAYEAGAALTVDQVGDFPTAHARCGTSFLLTVIVITVLIFAPFGQPPVLLRVLTRIALLPVIAGVAYEAMRLTARLSDRPWMRLLIAPNLAVQRLTTREPGDDMLEVAITALKTVLADRTVDELKVDEASEQAGEISGGHPGCHPTASERSELC